MATSPPWLGAWLRKRHELLLDPTLSTEVRNARLLPLAAPPLRSGSKALLIALASLNTLSDRVPERTEAEKVLMEIAPYVRTLQRIPPQLVTAWFRQLPSTTLALSADDKEEDPAALLKNLLAEKLVHVGKLFSLTFTYTRQPHVPNCTGRWITETSNDFLWKLALPKETAKESVRLIDLIYNSLKVQDCVPDVMAGSTTTVMSHGPFLGFHIDRTSATGGLRKDSVEYQMILVIGGIRRFSLRSLIDRNLDGTYGFHRTEPFESDRSSETALLFFYEAVSNISPKKAKSRAVKTIK